MRINKSIHLGILIALAVALIAVCLTMTYLLDRNEPSSTSNQSNITPGMLYAMAEAAIAQAETDPSAEVNTAHECRLAPTGVYYNSKMGWYVVTCVIQNKQNVFGIIFIEKDVVVNIGTINAMSQGDLESMLESVGYTK